MFDALNKGVYGGVLSCGALKQFGDFGIGTFEGLDGEMVLCDGVVYQLDVDGRAHVAEDSLETPFATVTFFKRDKMLRLPPGITYRKLQKLLDAFIGSKNFFYAVKITGTFKKMRTRSVPKQKHPYPPLNSALATQKTRDFESVRGTLVGFRCPAYARGINVVGYNCNFITEDKKAGGHVLDFVTGDVVVEVDTKVNFFMLLPDSSVFGKCDLNTK